MIVFNWVEFANFLSTGKTPIHVDIKKNQTTLIRGHNGAGKTTILEAIIYALFNKPFRNIKLGQLKNCINKKKMMVKINFTIRGITYEIHRGQSPKVFDLYSDESGEMAKVPATNDLQKHIENDILNTNIKTFTQAVVMASMKYQNFMDLSVGDRRIVVNQMLDLEVLTLMRDLLTSRKREANKRSSDIESKFMELRYKKDSLEQLIADSNKNNDEDITGKKEEIQKLQDGLDVHQIQMDYLKEQVATHNETKPDIDGDAIMAQISTLQQEISQHTSNRMFAGQSYNTDLEMAKFYANTKQCDRCHQDITDEFRQGELQRLKQSSDEHKSHGMTCNEKIAACQTKIGELNAQMDELNVWQSDLNKIYDEARGVRETISSVQQMVSIREEQLAKAMDRTNDDMSSKQDELHKLNEEYEQTISKRAEITRELEMCELTNQILSDKGVKAKVIREYLPVINQSINYYLDVMGANYSFVLDEQFNETILSRYRDNFSYGSFSNGEATRINFAIVFMLRKVAMMKNSVATNLLFLDEVFDGALDKEGFVYVAKLLEDMTDNNVFVISHRKEMESLVEHVIDVKKVGNFSQYDGL